MSHPVTHQQQQQQQRLYGGGAARVRPGHRPSQRCVSCRVVMYLSLMVVLAAFLTNVLWYHHQGIIVVSQHQPPPPPPHKSTTETIHTVFVDDESHHHPFMNPFRVPTINPVLRAKFELQQQQQRRDDENDEKNEITTTTSRAENVLVVNTTTTTTRTPTQQQQQVEENENSFCLTDACLLQQAQKLSRAFPARASKASWCIPVPYRNDTFSINANTGEWQGLLLVKVPKAASSTSAGVALRIANHSACAVQYQHRPGKHYTNKTNTTATPPRPWFLFAPIRQPADRSLSAVWFFMISPLNIEPTDNNIIRSLLTERGGGNTRGRGGYQFQYLSPQPIPTKAFWSPRRPTVVSNVHVLHQLAASILQHYDFFLVTERMDESLTALALLLLSGEYSNNSNKSNTKNAIEEVVKDPKRLRHVLGHVLVTSSAKVSGSYSLARVGPKKGTCHLPRKRVDSPAVQMYVQSNEWSAMNYGDELLYRAANISLDRTIRETIGVDTFARALQEYRHLKEQAVTTCGTLLGNGCTADGVPLPPTSTTTRDEECYDRDFGCGYRCVDKMLQELD